MVILRQFTVLFCQIYCHFGSFLKLYGGNGDFSSFLSVERKRKYWANELKSKENVYYVRYLILRLGEMNHQKISENGEMKSSSEGLNFPKAAEPNWTE